MDESECDEVTGLGDRIRSGAELPRRRRWVRFAAVGAAGLTTVLIAAFVHAGSPDNPRLTATSLMFDDFNGPAGTSPDAQWWSYDTGGGGWGNSEAQTYTSAPENVRLDGAGHLVIEARHDGAAYTSARVTTKGRVSFTNGRAEARMRLPRGVGLHPAFWLLGTDIDAVGWPASGEIDVVETLNDAPSLFSTLHGPKGSGGEWEVSATTGLAPSFVDDFHVYWVQKDPGSITMGVDDRVTGTFRAADVSPDQRWVFDKPFFLLFNVAVGGDWPGPVDSSTRFPAAMIVDWVKVTGD
jgi:beta-glucanase (GH16 family)